MPQEVGLFKSKFPSHNTHLIHKERHVPHRRIVRPVGVSAAQLVIEDNRTTGLGQPVKGFQALMGHRPAMDQEDGKHARLCLGHVPDHAIPCAISTKGNESFTDRNIAGHG
jgi:hypothetical protein